MEKGERERKKERERGREKERELYNIEKMNLEKSTQIFPNFHVSLK